MSVERDRLLDRRLAGRRIRGQKVSLGELESTLASSPDLAGSVHVLDDEECAKFRAELVAETELRRERVLRAVARAAEPPPVVVRGPVEPFEESEI